MGRVTGKDAQAILLEEIGKFSSRIDPIMDIQKSGPRAEARQLEWWLKDFDDTESATTDRNKAYLRAYRRIAGHERLYAQGLPLADRGSIYMDRSVMRRLYRDGFVTFHAARDPHFLITESGDEMIAE